MSVLTEIVRQRREWATSRETEIRAQRRLQILEFLLALSILALAVLIYRSGPQGVQRFLTTGAECVRSLSQPVLQLFS